MYSVMKNVILSKKLSVAELKRRIDVFFAQGALDAEQKIELDELVYENATPDAEKAELAELYRALALRVNEMDKRIAKLENGSAEDEIPDWKPWDGVSGDYVFGAVVSHNGKVWENMLQGQQNVWEPGVVDERYWKEVLA